MIVDRRHGLGLMAGMSLASAAGAVTPRSGASTGPMTHHVFFWLKHPDRAADRDKLIAGLKTLRGIPQIRALRIGIPAATEARSVVDSSYDVSELMFFDTLENQKSYQDHPLHQRFVADCGDLWDRVVVYDSTDV